MPRLKKTWADGDAALGLWVSSDSGSVAEILATQDVDYLNIDMQHGLVDYSGALDVMRALSATSATITNPNPNAKCQRFIVVCIAAHARGAP